MLRERRLGPQFRLLWAAYAASTFGTWIAFDAFPLIAILVLHTGPAGVSILKAAGLAVGTLVAVPLGPWVEFHRKRPVMVAMDLIRFSVLISIPISFALGWLTFTQLLIASIVGAASDIAFRAASGAYLKAIVQPDELLIANGRLESTMWTATAIGPPLGGMAIGLFGPVITVVADAASYMLSALGILAIRQAEGAPAVRSTAARMRAVELFEGWRYILAHPMLRPLFFNTILVNGLPSGIAIGPASGHPIRSAQNDAHRWHLARILVSGPGFHPARRCGARTGHRRAVWIGELLWTVQSAAGLLPARSDRQKPDCPHPVRLVDLQ